MAMTKKQRAAYIKKWNEKNKERRVYLTHKHNSLRRGINYELSFKQFMRFAIRTGYINKRGQSSESLTIDRINPDPNIGYRMGNIRAITLSENIKIQRKLEFHLKHNNNSKNEFRYSFPAFQKTQKVVHL